MSAIVRMLAKRPVVIGNVVKAVVALGALVGLAATDAATEAIVGVVLAMLALVAAITGAEQSQVTPVESVAKLIDKPVQEVNDLLRDVTRGT